MATTAPEQTRQLTPEHRFLLSNIVWEGYETMLRLVGNQRIRMTYDRGDLELMSPSREHDEFGNLLGRIVETVTEELRIPCRAAGSTTWRKKARDRGLEADECYYLASFPQVRGRRGNVDLAAEPLPDLAIEVEISRSALDRMGIYAALCVPEVWRFDGKSLRIAQLQADGTYVEVGISPSLPFLFPHEIVRWVHLAGEIEDHSEWGRLFREWVRNELAPRREGIEPAG